MFWVERFASTLGPTWEGAEEGKQTSPFSCLPLSLAEPDQKWEVKGNLLMQVMKVSFSAPEQDGEDGVGAEGQMENTEPSHHGQAPCYPWMWRSWGNSLGPWLHRIYCKFCIGACTIGSLVHAPMNLAKHLKEKIGTIGGNNKGSLLDWRSACGCTISAEPAKWMIIKEHPRPGQSMNKGLWHTAL